MSAQEPNIVVQAVRFGLEVANGRSRYSKLIPVVCLLADAVLCGLVIWKVPYTEIDWVAYMEQVAQYISGERDYTKINGGTGPLVYPAAHVYIYTALYHITDQGRNILLAQQVFAVLYHLTLMVVMTCYWQAKAPPYVFPLLILSKRLHSIFILRCFNDCFAVCFLWLAIFCLQRRQWAIAGIIFSWGLGVKMSLLLVLPALAVILFLGRGLMGSIRVAWLMAQIQLAIAVPFLAKDPWAYLGRGFELSRQFFFKWTVNWRFVGEEVFLSREFSAALLVLHASALLLFITTKWLKPSGKTLAQIVVPFLHGRKPLGTPQEERVIARSVTPTYILTTILSANVAGLLFARSLHYQFYAYLAWSTPFLLWRSGIHPILQYALWALQEWAWNVFPSTPASSGVVVAVMAVTVMLSWLGPDDQRKTLEEATPATPIPATQEKSKMKPAAKKD